MSRILRMEHLMGIGLILLILTTSACRVTSSLEGSSSITPVSSLTSDPIHLAGQPGISMVTRTPTPSLTPLPSATPTTTETPEPTSSQTATITPTPTSEFPQVTILMQAFCRYGPGKAYLYSHGLYEGDHAEVHGRNYTENWLWVKPYNLDRHCWMAASVAEAKGNISSLPVVQSKLPYTTFIEPPKEVNAQRDGDRVKIYWSAVDMKPAEDSRGYLIEATVCQGGYLVSLAVHTKKTTYEFDDESGCSGESGGKLYAVEKHGYTDPVTIPWP